MSFLQVWPTLPLLHLTAPVLIILTCEAVPEGFTPGKDLGPDPSKSFTPGKDLVNSEVRGDGYKPSTTTPRPVSDPYSGYGIKNSGYGDDNDYAPPSKAGDAGAGGVAPHAVKGSLPVAAKTLSATTLLPQMGGRYTFVTTTHPQLRQTPLVVRTTTMAVAADGGSSGSSGSSSSSFYFPYIIVLVGLVSGVALGAGGILVYRTRLDTRRKECELLMQDRQGNNRYKTAFEWDSMALDGCKIGNWQQFRAASERFIPGIKSDFLYSHEEFLRARSDPSVQLVNEDEFRTRVWLE